MTRLMPIPLQCGPDYHIFHARRELFTAHSTIGAVWSAVAGVVPAGVKPAPEESRRAFACGRALYEVLPEGTGCESRVLVPFVPS
jgi:hypothetical protein